jgi:hypothetical protein
MDGRDLEETLGGPPNSCYTSLGKKIESKEGGKFFVEELLLQTRGRR